MADVDQILEAEQSIQQIASELSRMRDAATLLQESLTNSESVITASKELIETTERFSEGCGRVVNMLAQTDLGQKLESLQQIHVEVEEAKSNLVQEIRSAFSFVQNEQKTYASEIKSLFVVAEDNAQLNTQSLKKIVEAQGDNLHQEYAKLTDKISSLTKTHSEAIQKLNKQFFLIFILVILTFCAASISFIWPIIQPGYFPITVWPTTQPRQSEIIELSSANSDVKRSNWEGLEDSNYSPRKSSIDEFSLNQEKIENRPLKNLTANLMLKENFVNKEIEKKYNSLLNLKIRGKINSNLRLATGLSVVIELAIESDGNASAYRIINSSGSRDFDIAMIIALAELNFPELPKNLSTNPPYVVPIRINT